MRTRLQRTCFAGRDAKKVWVFGATGGISAALVLAARVIR
jgi:hypothetical protein